MRIVLYPAHGNTAHKLYYITFTFWHLPTKCLTSYSKLQIAEIVPLVVHVFRGSLCYSVGENIYSVFALSSEGVQATSANSLALQNKEGQ